MVLTEHTHFKEATFNVNINKIIKKSKISLKERNKMFANENKNFKKCGELLIDLNTSNKENKIFIFNCTFCNIEYDTLNKFGLHIEEHLNIGDVFKEAVIKFEAEPEEITISKYTNEEQFNEKVSSSFNTTTVIPGNKKAIERRKKDENNICVNSEQIVINTPLVVPSINKESVDDTNSIIIKKEISDYHTEPLVVKENKLEVYNNDEEFLDNTTFVIPTIKKEAESNDFTNTICIKEEIPESHVEGFVINEIKQEIENTESIDCVEEASNTEPKVDSDSTKIIEIVIKNSSAESDNETMEQIEQILGIKRKAKICSNDGKKLKSLKVIILKFLCKTI